MMGKKDVSFVRPWIFSGLFFLLLGAAQAQQLLQAKPSEKKAPRQEPVVDPKALSVPYPIQYNGFRDPNYKGPIYKFETRNTSQRWKEIVVRQTPLPVIEIADDRTLDLFDFNETYIGKFRPSGRKIMKADRGQYYHNGIFKLVGNRYFFQMIYRATTGEEVMKGWVSSDQIVAPVYDSLKSFLKTEASTAACRPGMPCYSGPSSLVEVGKQIEPLLLKTNLPVKDNIKAFQPNDLVCPMPAPYSVRMTSPHGMRKHPVLRYNRMHHGIDFGTDRQRGAPKIQSMADGKVISSGWAGGYGRRVVVEARNGTIFTYNHLALACELPSVGRAVSKGTQLGCMGMTGISTGVHLHLEVYKNKADYDAKKSMNPMDLVDFKILCDKRFTNETG